MNLRFLFRGARVSQADSTSASDVPEVAAVRLSIANIVQARKALSTVEAERDMAVRELNERIEKHGAAHSRLTGRIKQLAQANELPDRQIPEVEEVNRLALHISIRKERVNACEAKRTEAVAGLDTRIREAEAAWGALGAAISQDLLERYRDAIFALRDVHSEYLALRVYFQREWASSIWPFFNPKLAILDPKSTKNGERELLIDPRFIDRQDRWPNCAREALASIDELRLEIETAKKGFEV